MAKADLNEVRRFEALRLAVQSHGAGAPTKYVLNQAAEFEAYLRGPETPLGLNSKNPLSAEEFAARMGGPTHHGV